MKDKHTPSNCPFFWMWLMAMVIIMIITNTQPLAPEHWLCDGKPEESKAVEVNEPLKARFEFDDEQLNFKMVPDAGCTIFTDDAGTELFYIDSSGKIVRLNVGWCEE